MSTSPSQRVTKTSTGTSTPGTRLYALDETGRPLGVYVVDSGASNGYRVEEEYVHLDGWRPVAVVRPDASTGMANPKVFPILTDHLGTPRKVLDGDTGDTRWAWDAKQPFGHELPNETPTSGLPAFAFDLRFPGQRYDDETGLFHNGFRDYHPGLGRYVQSDPLGLEAGWNTFSYVSGTPLSLIDPLGLIQRGSYKPDGNPIKKKCRGPFCAYLEPGTMLTDKGSPFKVYRLIRGDSRYYMNCHGYGFDLEIWVEDPLPVYKDEYERVSSENEAELILWVDEQGKVKHTSKVLPFMNMGKNGTYPIGPDPKLFHHFKQPIYFRRKSP